MLTFLANIIVGFIHFISNFINSYDTYYENTEEYLSKNVQNGRIFYDIGTIEQKSYKASLKFASKEYKSKPVQNMIIHFRLFLNNVADIPVVAGFIRVLVNMQNAFNNCSRLHLIIIFVIFPFIAYLINQINTSLPRFFVVLIPVILVLLFLESGLFSYINKRQKDDKSSLAGEYFGAPGNYHSVVLVFLFLFFIECSLFLALIQLSSFSIQLFKIFKDNALLLYTASYFLLFISLTVFILIVYMGILMFQASLIAILEKADPVHSLNKAMQILNKNLFYSFTYTGSISILILFLVSFTFFYLSDFALLIVLTFIIHIIFLFSYGFQKTFSEPDSQAAQSHKSGLFNFFLFSIFLLTGVVGYVAFSTFALKNYPSVSALYFAWQHDRELEQQFKRFTDQTGSYSIFYPNEWTIYRWNEKSATFLYNVNNTSSGKLTFTVTILPVPESDYFRLNSVAPGTVIVNTETNESSTKIVNMIIDGFDAVKYRTIKPNAGFTEYTINYMVIKNDNIYKISFAAIENLFLQTYSGTFDTMLSTFHFIKTKK